MTPHRDGTHGTFVIDLRLGKLGRFKAASGTTDPSLFRDVVGTIRSLRAARQWDLLSLLVNRQVHPLELHRAVIQQRVGVLPTPEDLLPIGPVAERWLANLDRATSTRRQYTWRLAHFGAPGARLADVPQLLEAARAQAIGDGKRVAFNGLRITVRRLMDDMLGLDHQLTRRAHAIRPLRATHRLGNPQSVDEVRALTMQLGPYGPSFWALCLTGMRQAEYFRRRYEVKPECIVIHGTKTHAAERVVPRVYPISDPIVGYDRFRQVLADVTRAVRVHDTRYTFTRWCDDAGVPTPRLSWYLGHAAPDVTARYGRGRGFVEYLTADAEKLRGFLGDAPVKGLAIVG